ncbi:MAG: WYL domain-containing protein [Bacteroidia bacterium]
MALNKEAYIRYKIIDGCIRSRQKPFPSMDDLITTCEKKLGKPFSISTIQKDIKAMKEDEQLSFMAPIKFSKSRNGYYYANPDYSISQIPLQENEIASLLTASDLLQVISGSRVGESFDTAVSKIITSLKGKSDKKENPLPSVLLESPPKQSGWQHFELLLNAIKSKTPLSFIYYSFSAEEFSTDIFHPYQLAEFQNYWYVIGYSESRKRVRVCGLDKIFDPLELKLPYNNSRFNEVKKYNTDMYGIKPIGNQKKQKIAFAAATYMANYLKAHPLHSSQRVAWIDYRGAFVFTINVIPTDELIRWFFTHSDCVQVKENEFIINKIKELANASMSLCKI